MPKGDSKQVRRVDYMPFPDEGPEGSWMVQKMELTDEGYLTGRAIATNVGVFPYIMDDGSVLYELRAPEEVFHPDSVKTLEKALMTNNHPVVLVDAENSKELQVGFTGDVRQDQYHLAPSITITDKDAVQDVMDGKRGLSCGYTADVVMESGNWMGIHYDATQKNIRYNHLAIVPKGRAGDAAKLKLDSADSVGVLRIDKKNSKEGSVKMAEITVNSRKYKVDNEEFVSLYQDTAKELETSKTEHADALKQVNTDLAKSVAKCDQLDEENTKLKAEVEELKKNQFDTAEVDQMVKDRMALLDSAEKAGVEIKEDMSTEDIQREVVLSVFPTAKEKLDAGDETYLKARFDGAVEVLTNTSGLQSFKEDSLGNKPVGTTPIIKKPKDKEHRDSDDARQDMINRQRGIK